MDRRLFKDNIGLNFNTSIFHYGNGKIGPYNDVLFSRFEFYEFSLILFILKIEIHIYSIHNFNSLEFNFCTSVTQSFK